MTEPGVGASLAMLTAVMILASLLPLLNSLLGVEPRPDTLQWPGALLGLLLMTFIVTLLAGLYPAVMASRTQPVEALRAEK